MQLLTMIRTAFRRWAVYETTYRELSEFSDRQLADIGIQRSEIRDIAREAALRAAPKARATPETRRVSSQVATAN